MDKRARVDALIARALDDGASAEEARTSAHIAVRLIRDHGLLGAEATKKPTPPTRRVIRVKYSSHCAHCFKHLNEGDSGAWAAGAGVLCAPCYREERS